VIDVVSRCK